MRKEQIIDLMKIAAANGDWKFYNKLKEKLK